MRNEDVITIVNLSLKINVSFCRNMNRFFLNVFFGKSMRIFNFWEIVKGNSIQQKTDVNLK